MAACTPHVRLRTGANHGERRKSARATRRRAAPPSATHSTGTTCGCSRRRPEAAAGSIERSARIKLPGNRSPARAASGRGGVRAAGAPVAFEPAAAADGWAEGTPPAVTPAASLPTAMPPPAVSPAASPPPASSTAALPPAQSQSALPQ
eukprot:1926453-Prymnesium_polylepis.1